MGRPKREKYLPVKLKGGATPISAPGLNNSTSKYPAYNCHSSVHVFCLVIAEWCTVLCLEDNKKYPSPVSKLESTDDLQLCEDDLVPGKTVIWYHRNKIPYEAQLLKIYGEFPSST